MTTTIWRPEKFIELMQKHATDDRMAIVSSDAVGEWAYKEKGDYIKLSFGISADGFKEGKLDNLLSKGTLCFVVVLIDKEKVSERFRHENELVKEA